MKFEYNVRRNGVSNGGRIFLRRSGRAGSPKAPKPGGRRAPRKIAQNRH